MSRELVDVNNVDPVHKNPKKYCCDEMQTHLTRTCNIHSYYQCADNVVAYLGHGKYGLIIHDTEYAASSVYRIRFCPWCGNKLGRH